MSHENACGGGTGCPSVSVIMNCHNGAAFLAEAVRSVLAQTYRDYEVVFWDNCSTDGSAALFQSFSDSRFRYFKGESLVPLGEARNLAAGKARGTWLAFLDCDDLWTLAKLEQQMIRGAQPGVSLVYGYTELIVDDAAKTVDLAKMARIVGSLHTGCVRGHLPTGNIFRKLIADNFIPLSSLCVRRSVFEQVGGFNGHLTHAEDYDLLLKLSAVCEAGAVQETCCFYRLHASNASHGAAPRSIAETIEILSQHIVPGAGYGPAVRRSLRRHQARLLLHQIRGGDRAKAPRVLLPSLWAPLLALLARQMAWRLALYFRSMAGRA